MSIKVQNYKSNNGQNFSEVYIKVKAVTIDIEVWDKKNKRILSKEKKTRMLGDNIRSKIGEEAYKILKSMGDINNYEDVFESKSLWHKLIDWAINLLKGIR